MAMDSFPMFFTVRAIAFTLIVFLALIWLILVSVEIFTRWSISDKSLMFFLMLTNAVTIFIPPVLLILEFLNMAGCRTSLVDICSADSPQIQYPDETADDMGVCKLLNAYTVMACWIIPVISSTLLSCCICSPCIPVTVDSPKIVPSSAKPSVLPIMDPEMGEKWFSTSQGSSDSGPSTPNRSSHRAPPLLPLILPRRQSTLPVQSPGLRPTSNHDPFHSSTSSATSAIPICLPTLVESTTRRCGFATSGTTFVDDASSQEK
ncbi:hypothetical protein EDC04DRAFT_2912990 [Pisolithus marmoratus]|nr:hypothetical protein EDC04DRAFT_2912990 [Pisolithus marmoratus]